MAYSQEIISRARRKLESQKADWESRQRQHQQRKPRRQRDHEDGDVGPDELLLQSRFRLPRGGAAVGGPIGFRFHR